MKTRSVYTLGVSVVLALVLAAASASSAAAAEVLEIEEGSTPVLKGTVATAGLEIDGCLQFTQGTITVNGKSKDAASFNDFLHEECAPGVSERGDVKSVQISTAGVASFKADLKLTTAENCVYPITKFTVHFVVPGEAVGGGEGTGKLDKPVSKTGCAATKTFPLEAAVSATVLEPFLLEDRG